MDLTPPPHGPADRTVAPPPADLPDVAESVTGRARDLRRLADLLSGGPAATTTPPAVAMLRAHAGAVDDLAEHLLSAGGPGDEEAPASDDTDDPTNATDDPTDDPTDDTDAGRSGSPRTAG